MYTHQYYLHYNPSNHIRLVPLHSCRMFVFPAGYIICVAAGRAAQTAERALGIKSLCSSYFITINFTVYLVTYFKHFALNGWTYE